MPVSYPIRQYLHRDICGVLRVCIFPPDGNVPEEAGRVNAGGIHERARDVRDSKGSHHIRRRDERDQAKNPASVKRSGVFQKAVRSNRLSAVV
jgi:hypothetical protein